MTATSCTTQLATLAHKMAVTHKVTFEHMQSLGLEELCRFVKNQDVVASTQTYLQQLFKGCLVWNALERPQFKLNARVFLMAYLIGIHRNRVLETINEDTSALIAASDVLIRQFKRITNVLLLASTPATRSFKESRVKELSQAFYDAVVDYFPKFYAWKTVDEGRLFIRITHAIWHMLRTKMDLLGDQERFDPLDPFMQLIEVEVDKLRMKLKLVCGAETLLDFDALIASEMANRRSLLLLRQEHARNVGHGPVFDLID